MIYYESMTEEQTFNIGYQIGQNAKIGEIYCLIGDLGVGKTIFSKGFAKGLDIKESVTSPTFTIIQEYYGSMPLYHFDMYRIEDSDELEMIGYEDYFYGQGVCLVEWANNVSEVIPKEAKWIFIEKDLTKGFDYRKVSIKEVEA